MGGLKIAKNFGAAAVPNIEALMQRDRELVRQTGELERAVMQAQAQAAQSATAPAPQPMPVEMPQPEMPPEGMM